MIAFSTPPAKLDELRSRFRSMDEDGDGSLSREEFARAVAKHDPSMSAEHIGNLFDQIDSTHSGQVAPSFLPATPSISLPITSSNIHFQSLQFTSNHRLTTS